MGSTSADRILIGDAPRSSENHSGSKRVLLIASGGSGSGSWKGYQVAYLEAVILIHKVSIII